MAPALAEPWSEGTDEPLNGVSCPKAQSGWANSHRPPSAPQAPPGAGVMDTDVRAIRLLRPTFPPALFSPCFAKVHSAGLDILAVSSGSFPFPERLGLEFVLHLSYPSVASRFPY